jgi:hypothetical protein
MRAHIEMIDAQRPVEVRRNAYVAFNLSCMLLYNNQAFFTVFLELLERGTRNVDIEEMGQLWIERAQYLHLF